MEELYKQYGGQGFTVLAFPCNQFGHQDPGSNSEILNFCTVNYGVTFPVMAKIEVNGKNEEPVFTFLKSASSENGQDIKWNFTKFLVDKTGTKVKRYEPPVNPEEIKPDIEAFLKKAD